MYIYIYIIHISSNHPGWAKLKGLHLGVCSKKPGAKQNMGERGKRVMYGPIYINKHSIFIYIYRTSLIEIFKGLIAGVDVYVYYIPLYTHLSTYLKCSVRRFPSLNLMIHLVKLVRMVA